MENPQQGSQPQVNPLDAYWKQLGTGRKIIVSIGTICFIAPAMLTIINLGFTIEHDASNGGFMTGTMLWIVNIILGMIGGLCLGPKKIAAGVLAGGVANAAITGITLLYVSWRDTLYSIEFIIPILLGLLVGWMTFVFLGGKPKKMTDENWNIWTGYNGKNRF